MAAIIFTDEKEIPRDVPLAMHGAYCGFGDFCPGCNGPPEIERHGPRGFPFCPVGGLVHRSGDGNTPVFDGALAPQPRGSVGTAREFHLVHGSRRRRGGTEPEAPRNRRRGSNPIASSCGSATTSNYRRQERSNIPLREALRERAPPRRRRPRNGVRPSSRGDSGCLPGRSCRRG